MLNNIKQIRKSLGITVAELAQKLNMSQGNLTKIENGQVDMKAETAAAIAAILQCPLDKLIAEEKTTFRRCHCRLICPQTAAQWRLGIIICRRH